MVQRVNTGVRGLDENIEDGFPEGSVTLVTGGPGVGKTTFCLNFLNEGLENDENCLYITTGQDSEELRLDAIEYDIDFDNHVKNLSIAYINPSKGVEQEVIEYIKEEDFDRIVLDSISVFEMYWGQNSKIRKYLNRIVEHLKDLDTTAVVTSEMPESQSGKLSRFGVAEFVVDGVIKLQGYALGDSQYRSLQVVKMRRTAISGDILELTIDENGVSVSEGDKFTE